MPGFKDSEFMTAREKDLVLSQWKRFVERGFSFEHFTDRIYKHLSLHCSFIAHFNRSGFFSTYLRKPRSHNQVPQPVRQRPRLPVCGIRGNWWLQGEYADINTAMCNVVEANKLRLYEELERKVRGRDLAIASQLLAKHGVQAPMQQFTKGDPES